ncbi:thiosulfate/3-mercaptopyruvate sulfurtransferase [Malonomonas rubra DSM 5091]|uniref:Thiosulfate/3-mercaptopyruvate sulfurtransferase n=1 Tax=Malonomonas rubra DSM 5091 TaxID=1122189 RepID=A0A1M6MUZ8_MALRU|nr:sulfurtransferase [Malonomonas rubra]SHJ87274.1 thiosulfate/3-mercaptopyruvate sulfurtransferase [Malonomonas rubra DSM 5091]
MKRLTHLLLVAIMVLAVVPFTAAEALAEKVFVKAEQVAELIEAGAPKLRVIDCRLEEKDYKKGHVPGAVYMNVRKDLRMKGAWDTIGVRRQIEAQEELFGRQLGIDSDTMVVLYDDEGWDATRLFWELKYTGHEKVAIIFGGWPEWQSNKLPVSKDVPKIEPALFVADVQPELLATSSYIMSKMGDPNTVLLDVRPPEQFKGDAKHPAAKIGGRLPSAVNAFTLANWENKTYLKNPAELVEMYADLGVTPDKEIVLYCNTGYYAANSYFILKALDFPNVRVYDYSWVEWNGKGHLPKIVGKAK